ncbi:MAG TPA: hypothetical protein VFM18_02860 [Methanosarcina sp.]|nr:hypothetical protein [Methanosarcina sp.]
MSNQVTSTERSTDKIAFGYMTMLDHILRFNGKHATTVYNPAGAVTRVTLPDNLVIKALCDNLAKVDYWVWVTTAMKNQAKDQTIAAMEEQSLQKLNELQSEYKFERVHKSRPFCNANYFQGNYLNYTIWKVTKNV